MTRLPDGLAGKALALLLLGVVPLLLYVAILAPLSALRQANEEQLALRQQRVQQLATLVAQLPRLREAAKALDADENADMTVVGQTDAVAAGMLQSGIKAMVEDAGGAVSSSEILEPRDEDGFHEVGVRVAFTGDLELLTTVLGADAGGSGPVFAVRAFDIRSAAAGEGEGEAEADGDMLSVVLDAYGVRSE